MASTKARQRKLERDRYERKMVRRAQQQRRQRRIKAGVGAFLALAVIGAGTAWRLGAFDSAPEEPPLADRCFWDVSRATEPQRIDVGTPPGNPPESGALTVTIDLDAGDAGAGEVEFEMRYEDEPCGAASLGYLAAESFYDDTICHELTAEGALKCGDPSGTGEGGPGYVFYGENYPYPDYGEDFPDEDEENGEEDDGDEDGDEEEQEIFYPAGTVALADVVGANDGQFLIFHEDSSFDGPAWPILGHVTSGLDLLEAIGAAGAAGDPPGPPAQEVRIRSLTVTGPDGDTAPDES